MSHAALIDQRLRFLEIDDAVIDELSKARKILEPELDRMLDSFYAHVSEEPQLKGLFPDDEAMVRARKAQKNHWLESLLTGEFTSDHAERAEVIGRTHARVGLTPNWYIGGYSNMLTQFIKPVMEEASKEGRDASPIIEALCKAVMLDLDLVIHCYLEAKDRVIFDLLLHATRFIDELAETNEELLTQLAQVKESTDGLLNDAEENEKQAESLTKLADHAEILSHTIQNLDERINELKSGDRLYLQQGREHTGTFSQIVARII
jgi:hypothetical protein